MFKLNGRQKCFRKRDKWMKRLGFNSYRNYLRSNTWRRIRGVVLLDRKYQCKFCSNQANQVHHLRYTRPVLLGEGNYKSALVVTCNSCHKGVSEYAKKHKIHEEFAFQKYRAKGNLDSG